MTLLAAFHFLVERLPTILAQFRKWPTRARKMDLGMRLRRNRIRPNPADQVGFIL